MWLLTRKFGFDPPSGSHQLPVFLKCSARERLQNASEVANATPTYVKMKDICGWAQTLRAWCVMKDRKMCGFN